MALIKRILLITAALSSIATSRVLQDDAAVASPDTTWSWSSSADAQFIVTCMNLYQDGYKFCNVDNENSRIDNVYMGYGLCCPLDSTDVDCNESSTVTCTVGNKEKQGEALYLSYWPGMTNEACNRTSDTLVATTESQTFHSTQTSLVERDYSNYEACHYIIEIPKYSFMDGANIEVTVNYLNQANLYMYEGTSRHNATTVIEGNGTAVSGAPYVIPASSKVILVL